MRILVTLVVMTLLCTGCSSSPNYDEYSDNYISDSLADTIILWEEFNLENTYADIFIEDKKVSAVDIPYNGINLSEQEGNNIALYGQTDVFILNNETFVTSGSNFKEKGIVQSVDFTSKNEVIYNFNVGLFGETYDSYYMLGDLKVQSNGGLIVDAFDRDEFIYTFERNVPDVSTSVYKYDFEGNLIATIADEVTTLPNLNTCVVDANKNIVCIVDKTITVVYEDDTIDTFTIGNIANIAYSSTLFTIEDTTYGVSQGGLVFRVTDDYKIEEIYNTGADTSEYTNLLIFESYVVQQGVGYVVCEFLYTDDGINHTISYKINLLDGSMKEITKDFSFDTNQDYRPNIVLEKSEYIN